MRFTQSGIKSLLTNHNISIEISATRRGFVANFTRNGRPMFSYESEPDSEPCEVVGLSAHDILAAIEALVMRAEGSVLKTDRDSAYPVSFMVLSRDPQVIPD